MTDQQDIWVPRLVTSRLPRPGERTLVILTGPRQAGKTTLAQRVYPDLRYLSMDSIEEREALRAMRTEAWATAVGPAVIYEAQKELTVFEKVKHAFDGGGLDFSILLGSAQILLLRHIAETLAGRAPVFELWTLLACELAASGGAEPRRPLLSELLEEAGDITRILEAQPELLLASQEEQAIAAVEQLAAWGGMPALLRLTPERREDWLRSYVQTYLERDLADLARLSDLLPFRTFQRLSAPRAGQLVSFSELARDAKLSSGTARSYLGYLRISYQAFLLEPYHTNLTSTVIKRPKLFWTDLGILRHLAGHRGPLTGALFENLVVAEVVKWLHTVSSDARPFFYRTRSGLEVDLLLEHPRGLLGIEIKNRESAARSDATALGRLARALGDRWLGGLVVHRGRSLAPLAEEHRIWQIPAHRLLA